ncbi:DUF6456 domain-containing protein [Devosia aquimaris]|uniref:DUF6456 domain-containing protein n=1 Tax=Devosia aquimaris TaxID=2866214 RepID=UPI001CD13D32|nr:DUF6456 domain-containing protein [Devosia sp. CJK-A8-3]
MAGEGTVLTRLATASAGEAAFLSPEQLLAASRLEGLIRRAQLVQRVTMAYDPARIGRQPGGDGGVDLGDSAFDARRRLNQLAGTLPVDCWSVLFDVCGLGKGLQTIESERRWPRRSAKLVLRIALSQLATAWGLDGAAQGAETARAHAWMEQRLPIVPPLAD